MKEQLDLSLIKTSNVIAAIEDINQRGIPKNAQSSIYDLIYKGKPYPPKLVLSWAYKYATGNELARNLFTGGQDTPCFNCLKDLGFMIIPKSKELDLLYLKKVDYSMLVEGLTVTNDILPRFLTLFGNVEAGKQKKINIQLEQNVYQVEFRHIKRTNAPTVYQIRYPKNGKLSAHLISLFPDSYQLLEEQRVSDEKKKTYAKLPEDRNEFLAIYYDKKNKKLVWNRLTDKEDFYPTILKFIKQANTAKSLKVNEYPRSYKELEIKVSFGQGGLARIPWISFLYKGQTTSKGIYPCFLYYKEQGLLILVYGLSETNKPTKNWKLPNDILTVDAYFSKNKLGIPERYGKSYVAQVYLVDNLVQEQLDNNLQEIIDYYKRIMTKGLVSDNNRRKNDVFDKLFEIRRVIEIGQTGLLFDRDLLYRYTVSLLTKPFVILSGLSGSGKTKLALSFAKWITGCSDQVKIVSVGSDWNNREYLLGYPNALQLGEYIKPDNGVLDFIIDAQKNCDLPYFLILDEMNLSYVERYFADFLSAMESHEAITLHPVTGPEVKWNQVPATIQLPKNLYITGTINVDETTYMFSPKVLDRANVIEFRVGRENMEKYLMGCKSMKANIADHIGADMQKDFVRISRYRDSERDLKTSDILLQFFDQLKRAGAEFGYRTAAEIYGFVALVHKLNLGWEDNQIMDIVIMQKLLPKLHGSRRKMQPILNTLWNLCQSKSEKGVAIETEDIVFGAHYIYPLSAAKIWQMYKSAKDNGFTSYAEA